MAEWAAIKREQLISISNTIPRITATLLFYTQETNPSAYATEFPSVIKYLPVIH